MLLILTIKKNKVLLRTTINQFEKYIKLNKKIPPEILNSLNNIDNTDKLGDTIAAHIPLKISDKQSILEMLNIEKRLEYLMAIMESEIELLKIEKKNSQSYQKTNGKKSKRILFK